MKIETAWYEFSPYIYAAGGITAILYSPGSLLLKASGFLLFFALDRDEYDALLKQNLFYDVEN